MANTLVLVHGFMDSARRMSYMARHLRDLGWKVLTPSLQPSNGRKSIEMLAGQLDNYIQGNIEPDERIDLIGFSMGGLICRYYLQYLNGLRKTKKFISISTPHLGTATAYLLPGAAIRQMRPKSTFLQALNNNIEELEKITFVSFYTPYDLIVVPAESSLIPFAKNYKMNALLHSQMVSNQNVLDQIVAVLNEEESIT